MSLRPRTVFISFLLVFSIFISCRQTQHKPRQVNRAVYHWRNSDYINEEQRILIKRNKIDRVYVKLMDIDWEEIRGAAPHGRINYLENIAHYNGFADVRKVEFIPVIFITNKTFQRIDSADIPLLAMRILRKCFTDYDSSDVIWEAENFNDYQRMNRMHPSEIQFDCDWTVSTSPKYFYFLETIKKLLPDNATKITATIRLHQYKYPGKTGVPPVSRGMLMVYNIADITKYTNVNSIFEYDKAKPYFRSGKDYALSLDVALPAYSWGVVYRGKKFFTLGHGMTTETVNDKDHFSKTEKNLYAVKKDTLLNDLFLRPGDEIKIEGINEEKLMQAAKLACKALNSDSVTVSFFELSSSTLNHYSHETIEQVYNNFR